MKGAELLLDNETVIELEEKKPAPKKKFGPKDRIMMTQTYFALIILAVVIAVKILLPDLFETMCGQYLDFVTKPPVWDLDGITRIMG